MTKTTDLKTGERTYALYYDNQAYRKLEERIQHGLASMKTDSIGELTAMLWVGLLRHQPAATMETADSIIDDLGYEAVMEAVSIAIEQSPPFRKRSANA